MKTLLKKIVLLTFLTGPVVNAQNFVWIRGPFTKGAVGNYGTMGVAAPANEPGSRHGSATWTDNQGNLWLFGGEGYSTNMTLCWLADLWKYDITTNQWTWVKGPNAANATAVFGTMGVASPGNQPGAREFCMSWTDAAGDLWLYGGDGYDASSFGRLGDLWKYNISSNQWTWVSGFNTVTQNGQYGTMGVPSSTTMPGSRYGAAVCYDPASNSVWMFGGRGYDASGLDGHLGDLWTYNFTTGLWTWVGGPNSSFQTGTYGTLGVPAPSNQPGNRYFSSAWIDNAGDFYLFGGLGWAQAPPSGQLNDMWKYDMSTGNWVWVNGPSTINTFATHGTMGVQAANVLPGARYSQASWKDKNNDLWIFGGYGRGAFDQNIQFSGLLNSLFKYNIASNQWTWMKGDTAINYSGKYGVMGVPAFANTPGAREYNDYWLDNTGDLWLFGGQGMDSSSAAPGNLNDLWKYTIPCQPDSLVASSSSLCAGYTASITAFSQVPSTVQWYTTSTGGTALASGTVFVTQPLSTQGSPTTIVYYAEANSCTLNPRAQVTISVAPAPTVNIAGPSTVCAGSTASFTAQGVLTHTWSTGSTALTTSLVPSAPGATSIVLIGSNQYGCENSASLTYSVLAAPSITISSTLSGSVICDNHQYILTASGANTYLWHNNSTAPTFSFSVPSGPDITFSVTGTNSEGCKSAQSVTYKIQVCSGLAESSLSASSIYPNPSGGTFSVKLAAQHAGAKLEVFNAIGQLIIYHELNGLHTNIKSDLADGVYLYRISDGRQSASGRLIIR